MIAPTSLTKLLAIQYPIIQGGMVWVSGAKLAAAVSNSGGLGVIGAGSMNLELLEKHIKKAQSLTDKNIGINIPLLYKDSQKQIELAIKLGIKTFITSAGSPKKYTHYIKENGGVVGHVTSTPLMAKKCEDAGVDFVIVEGHEAGGHNGRDELTTMVLIPQTRLAISIPLVAAGGIASGEAILAARVLGADGVQMGTRFVMTQESSAHDSFKNLIQAAGPLDTTLCMKETVPVRLLHNQFYENVMRISEQELSLNDKKEKLTELLGKGRARKGMLEGDTEQGELEIGQIAGMIKSIPTVSQLMIELLTQYDHAKNNSY